MISHRRTFLQTAAGALAAQTILPAQTVKMVKTPVLNIGYEEAGQGFPVILLHGFPDDAHAYDGVSPILAAKGYRALAVYLRGYGPTRFLDLSAPRMAEQAAIGQDVIDFADALHLDRFAVAGYDWGGRAACIAAALHPERVRAAVVIGGYSIQNTVKTAPPRSPESESRLWYQYYFNTERGRAGLMANRKAICKYLWKTWSPTWNFSDDLYNLTAASFENPDFVACVIHSYRHRLLNAPGEPRFKGVEEQLAKGPKIQAPTIILRGGDDTLGGRNPPEASDRAVFPNLISRSIVPGAGHFVPHEKPTPVAQAILQVLDASN